MCSPLRVSTATTRPCRCWPKATGRAWTYVRDDRPFAGPDPARGGVLLLAQPSREGLTSGRKAACGNVKLQGGCYGRLSERKATMIAVIVYRFQAWDQSAGEYKLSRRMATREGIEMCKGEALEDSAIEIDSSHLERGDPAISCSSSPSVALSTPVWRVDATE